MQHEPDVFHLGGNLPQHLQPFAAHGRFKIIEPGDVAGRTREVRHKSAFDWIGSADEKKRHCSHFRLQDRSDQIGIGHHQVRFQSHQFDSMGAHLFAIVGGISNINCDVASLRPAQFLKFLLKCRNERLRVTLP